MSESTHDIPGNSAMVALHEVIQGISRQNDLRLSLSLVAEKARVLSRAGSTAVILLDPARTLLDFAAVAGDNAAEILGQSVRVEDAFAGQTALTGEIYLSHNPHGSLPLLNDSATSLATGSAIRSAAVVPIYTGGHSVGALAALNREDGGAFAGEDILCLQTLANMAALCLTMDGLRRAASRKQRERDILFHAARTTSSSLNVQDVLTSVLATLKESLDMASGAVYLLNDERTQLYISSEVGLDEDERERQLEADRGPAAQALAGTQAIHFTDTTDSNQEEEDPLLPRMNSVLAAPMLSRAMPEGIIAVGSHQSNAYTAEDAALLSAVASQAAVALENAWLYEDAMRRAQEATALYELSQAVGSTLSLSQMMNFVADSVLSLLHVDKFALFLLDPPHGECMQIKVARNLRPEAFQTMHPRLGEGIAGWVLEFETPTAVQDVSADHRNRSCPIDTEGVTSLVSVPLQSGEQVIGVLMAMSSRRRLFTVSEMELLYTIANQVGAAIANAQMFEEARQKKAELRKYVRRVARALGSSVHSQGAAQVIADLAAEMTGADRSVLLSFDSGGILSVRAVCNMRGARSVEAISMGEGETPAARIARRGRSLMIEDLGRDKYLTPAYAAKERVTGYLGVPLKLGKVVLGVLEIYTKEARIFTSDEVRLLITVASQAAVALQNALLVEQAGRRISDLQFLDVLSRLLREHQDTQRLLSQAIPLLCEAVNAESGMVNAEESDTPLIYCYHRVPEDKQSQRPAVVSVPLASAQASRNLGRLTIRRLAPFDEHDQKLISTSANLLSMGL